MKNRNTQNTQISFLNHPVRVARLASGWEEVTRNTRSFRVCEVAHARRVAHGRDGWNQERKEVVSVASAESDTGVEAFKFLGAGKEQGDSASGSGRPGVWLGFFPLQDRCSRPRNVTVIPL